MKKLLVGAVAAGFVGSTLFFGDGIATADDVIMVPGTAPPSGPASKFYHFKPEWVPQIGSKYYSNPDITNNPGTKPTTTISYPAANPTSLSGNNMPVGKSVAIGADNLDAAIKRNNGPMTVVGLSQGAEVMTEEQLRLAHDPDAPPPDQITFVKVSDPAIVLRRLFKPGTHLPIFNYTVPPPVESQYNTVNVVAQYDFVGDPPDHWWNLLAVLNSGVGVQHSMVAFSDPASVPPENVTRTVNSLGGVTTTYRVPEAELPLSHMLRGAGVPGPIVDTLNPEMTRIVDAGYNRNNPNPFPNPNSGLQLPNLGGGDGLGGNHPPRFDRPGNLHPDRKHHRRTQRGHRLAVRDQPGRKRRQHSQRGHQSDLGSQRGQQSGPRSQRGQHCGLRGRRPQGWPQGRQGNRHSGQRFATQKEAVTTR